MSQSPTSRTLQSLRRAGWTAQPIQRFIAARGISIDPFGGDVLAVHPQQRQVLIVQCTSLSNLSARVRKVQGRPDVACWLQAGGLFQCWGWAPRPDGWAAKIVAITGDTMQADVVQALPRRRRRDRHDQGDLFG